MSRVNETTGLHHPSVPESIWREWLTEGDCMFLITLCCNSAHHVPVWAWRDYGITHSERRCDTCGALVKL